MSPCLISFQKKTFHQYGGEFTAELGLKTPKLNRKDLGKKSSVRTNLINKIFQRQRPALLSHNFERLIEWVGALNYKQFVDPKNVTSLFDVTIVVMYLTYDRCGVNIDEIFWESSFTSDLGID